MISVLDLPQLYTRPSAQALITALEEIKSEPPSWQATPQTGTPAPGTPKSPFSGTATPIRRRKVRSEGLAGYLTRIVSNRLQWLENDEERELVWDTASQRLSERSGRAAMGAMTRTFAIPTVVYDGASAGSGHNLSLVAEEEADEHVVHIKLHEPALTEDNMGFKTWASSFQLAKRMALLKKSIPHLPDKSEILELGAGTGLVGIAAAVVFSTTVISTDLPEILPNLQQNIASNQSIIDAAGAQMKVAVLDWSNPEDFCVDGIAQPDKFPLIMAADPVYSPQHPELLCKAVGHHLARLSDARVVVAIPLREGFGAERDDFRSRMHTLGLSIVQEGTVTGYEDWSAADDESELSEVHCWWTVWAWS